MSDEQIITEQDLAEALNGKFLQQVKEFAWRGKEAKLKDVPNEEMHSFQVWVGFTFDADAESKEELSFDKLGSYRFSCSPITKEDYQKAMEEQKSAVAEALKDEEVNEADQKDS